MQNRLNLITETKFTHIINQSILNIKNITLKYILTFKNTIFKINMQIRIKIFKINTEIYFNIQKYNLNYKSITYYLASTPNCKIPTQKKYNTYYPHIYQIHINIQK